MKVVYIFTLFVFSVISLESFSQASNDSMYDWKWVTCTTDDLLLKGNIYDPLFLVKGKVAGASVSKNGGHPGVPHHMIIRGLSSIYFGQNPVYVIDGIVNADINLIQPEDISSIEVLNNISSSAKYGNYGGNGIVIVETKRARNNKPLSLSYNSLISFDRVSNQYDLLSADEMRDIAKEMMIEDPWMSFYDGGDDVDYLDEIFRNAITHSHHLAGSGSIKNTSYYASISYKNQPGIIENSGSKRFGGNVKIKQTFFEDKVTIQAMANFHQQKIEGIDEFDTYRILEQTYRHNPTDPIYNDDGYYNNPQRVFNYFNPVMANNLIQNNKTKQQLLSGLQINYAISDNFKINLSSDYREYKLENSVFKPAVDIPGWHDAFEKDFKEYEKQLSAQVSINYSGNIKDAHNFSAEAGYKFRNTRAEFIQGRGMKPYQYIVYRREDFDTAIINNSVNSVFADFNYNYKHRYYLQAGVRIDNLSPLIERKGTLVTLPEEVEGKSMVYPSIIASWNISNEAFLKSQKWLSKFMISGGYGEAGKETNLYTLDENRKLDFEKSKEYNATLDFGFLQNRISGNFIYYKRTSFDIFSLPRVPVPPNLYMYIFDNSTEIENKGIEINILIGIVSKQNVNYSTSFTFSKNENKIKSMPKNFSLRYNYVDLYGMQMNEYSYTQLFEEGESLFAFNLPQFAGIHDNSMIFIREDGGYTNNNSIAKRVFTNTVLPEFELSWGNYLTIYKDIDFSFSLRYVNGHSIYQEAKMGLEAMNVPHLNALAESINSESFLPQVCDYYLSDASFVRLDNIVISYTLKLKRINPDCKLKLMIGANNLFTITTYDGLDPEINYNTRYPGVEKANVYPPIKSYFFGLNFRI